jgi:hypothetical protein
MWDQQWYVTAYNMYLQQQYFPGDTFSGTQKSYGSLIPERAVSPRRILLST